MRPFCKLAGVAILVLLVAGGLLVAGDPNRPSHYLDDDVQYFPAAPELRTAADQSDSGEHHGALGNLLFSDVVSVHFVGLGHPANPDGSLGGLVAGDGCEMKIYERYIVRDAKGTDGTIYRTLHAYEKLGTIEQRIPGRRDATHD